MGSRNSDRRDIVALLGTAPASHAWLSWCPACRRRSLAPIDAITERYPAMKPLHHVADRLRCTGCGKRGARIYCAELPPP